MFRLCLCFAVLCAVSAASISTISRVPKKVVTSGPNPWQRTGLYQGDIMTPEGLDPRNVLIDTSKWWNGRVYYKLDSVFDADETEIILASLHKIEQNSCLHFEEWVDQDDYIVFTGEPTGCWSWIGRQGGNQTLNLQRGNPGCVFEGTVIHETLHALGFHHQQSTFDRDDWVRINWENIEAGEEHNFDKQDNNTVTQFGLQYDYSSIMHYDRTAFSSNGKDTIVPLEPNVQIGLEELSMEDVIKLINISCQGKMH